uniref:Uncharacterized protein n=1 Tax=Amphora coffeiformis TaxID=265554 RepID=A0A7S3L2U9_9STRA|mmetsp:Transcript_23164/g.44129  ORF Transcript_23164/g.44129 Transcript_23164/m.44129 type:complete len:377 (-) Transcript_23164:15-1145(-)
MKFTSILILGLVLLNTLTEAHETLRRKKKGKKNDKKKRVPKQFYVGSMVTLTHVRDDGTTQVDHDILMRSLVNAFNKIHGEDSVEMDGGFVSKEWVIPEDDDDDDDGGESHGDNNGSLGRRFNPFAHLSAHQFVTTWSGRCVFCGWDAGPGDDYFGDDYWNDDKNYAMTTRFLMTTGVGKHKAFEAEVVNELRATGIESLQEVTHCFVEFFYSAAMTPALSEEDPSSDTKQQSSASLHAQVDIDYVLDMKFGEAELDMIGDIFAESYNLIHSGLGYKVTAVDFLRRVDLPEDKTPPHKYFNRIWWVKAEYECDGDCNLLPPVLAFTHDHGLHKAFEDLVCLKLKDSGLPAYHKARYCEIAFGFSGDAFDGLVQSSA